MSLKIMPPEMTRFLQVGPNEEAVDQPLYSMQSYLTAGATSYTFFQQSRGQATNGVADTNMDNAGSLSAGKRFAITALGVHFIPSAPQVNNAGASTLSALNDIKKVIEGIGSLNLTILNKTYLEIAPLSTMPSGMGVWSGGASYQRTQTSPADGDGFIAYGTNGLPTPSGRYTLAVPIPIPPQVTFSVVLTFPTAITVSSNSRIGIFLWGVQIRAKQ